MNNLLQYTAEAILCSGILYLLYRVVLEGKITFWWSRRYLVGTLIIGAVIPLVQIPVWPAEVVLLDPMTELPTAEPGPITAAVSTTSWQLSDLIGWIYGIGVVLIITMAIRQLLAMRTLRQTATKEQYGAYDLYRTRQRIAPFSFWRSIYLWDQTPQEELPAILTHEASHLKHHHTFERMVAEGLKALLWWNPCMWLTTRSLTLIEEAEADRDVLASGIEPVYYMTTIFKQLFGISPDIANGLPHSLNKKRFQMMTRKPMSSHVLLRATAVAATVAGLVCAFSLTAQATQYRTTEPASTCEQADTSRIEVTAAGISNASLATIESQPIQVTTFADTPATKAETVTPQTDEPYLIVEQMPRFEGGDLNHFRQWITERIKPQRTDDGNYITGRVIVSFVIERDGTLTSIKPLRSPDNRLTSQVVSVLLASPRWEAGIQMGEKVRVRYTLPVDFAALSAEAIRTQGSQESTQSAQQPLIKADKMPQFDGGDLNSFRMWVMTQVRYPKELADKKIEGRVVCQFIIDEQGKLTDPKILQSPDQAFSDEVLRILKASPDKWVAGEQDGKPTAVRYVLPIDFAIQ